MIDKTISQYNILEKLGEDGTDLIYKAEDIKLKQRIAFQFLPPILPSNPEFQQVLALPKQKHKVFKKKFFSE